jgi:hypothetical protein
MVKGAPIQTDNKDPRKLLRAAKIEWIVLSTLCVSPAAQRKYNDDRAKKMAQKLDLDALGYLVVSRRDGNYWIVDGQHRAGAMRHAGYENYKLPCEVYLDLTEAEEAELFLIRDERTAVTPYDRFRIGLTACREDETAIDTIVRKEKCRVSLGRAWDSIGAVSALRAVYAMGAGTLHRVLMVLRTAFEGDDMAFNKDILVGMGAVCMRYGSDMKDETMILRLASLSGGASILRRKAETLKLRTDRSMQDCMAGAIVEVYNSKGGKGSLGSWWK